MSSQPSFPQGPFRPARSLILASSSPRRQHLLAQCGLYFDVLPSRVSEPQPEHDELPEDYAGRMARIKAEDVRGRSSAGCILAADTIVVLGSRVLGKPDSPAQALETLIMLNGRTHRVMTGCCLLDLDRNQNRTFTAITEVTMARHSQAVLAAYVQTGEPMDKAGSYGIQGAGSFLVSGISGSYTNIVGLPVNESIAALLAWGVIQVASKEQSAELSEGMA